MGIAAEMAALRVSIDNSRSARNQLTQQLELFSKELSQEVRNDIATFRSARLAAAQKSAAERQAFVNNLRGNVNTFLSGYSKELQQAGAAFRGEVAQKKSDPVAVISEFSSPALDVEEVIAPSYVEEEVVATLQSEAVEVVTIETVEVVLEQQAPKKKYESKKYTAHNPIKRK